MKLEDAVLNMTLKEARKLHLELVPDIMTENPIPFGVYGGSGAYAVIYLPTKMVVKDYEHGMQLQKG